ncbi:catenin alpha-like [Ruditapes philippinarum]|uniref:catenin alpha-like n=1 Tax=Ruditapes philippinarum TaxID=129788 RepID=UPI00295A9CC0|nr:catenin alpha-like [Ruditapes philippinarum]
MGSLNIKWDPKNLEIRTKSVEKTLEPLVTQVTTLVNQKGPSNKKKGRSKKGHVLAAAVQKATLNFVEKGEEIARENPDVKEDMLAAVDEVRKTGEAMGQASEEFAADPCSSMKRGAMVRAARALLSAVTRLLILADMVDVHLLLKSLRVVENDLDRIRNASSQQELMDSFKEFGKSVVELSERAAQRQADLKDPRRRDDLAASRATLKKSSMMLLTASKAYVRHPELAAARANRDWAYEQLCDAVNTISGVAQATGQSSAHPYEGAGELAAALDELMQKVIMDPLTYNEVRMRPSLEERLESIISGAALMADSACTREDRRERIVQECNAVRQALQDLLTEYMNNCRPKFPIRKTRFKAGRAEPSEALDRAIDNMQKKTKDLRRQLRKAVVDHVSDSFLETNVPLLVLIEAAKAGDEKGVEEYAQVFADHANKLVEVNYLPLLCFSRQQIFIGILILYILESHILEDVNRCVFALQEGDADTLDRTAGAIRGRSARVCNVVSAEMDNYEPGPYTDRVMEAVILLRDQVMPNFAEKVEIAVDCLSQNMPDRIDENEFIDASRLVYDGVRDIRQAVLMNRTPEELDTDTDLEDEADHYDTRSRSSYQTDVDDLQGKSDRALMRELPQEEREQIQAQFEMFRMEKAKLDMEVAKWDDSGNDIIVMAKQMCMIMMEMTDFTRGRGPLKSTMDVINAAKKISEAGTKLDNLATKIADQCPDSASKKDLMAYLQRIALYCHQLNITSKVKADVQSVGGELIVSGLDSATSLIQAAKNLMNAVVLTVKACYVASTKYKQAGKTNIVAWKMKPPEKKPLVRREDPIEFRGRISKSAGKKRIEPIKALNEFQEVDMDSFC